MATKPPGAASDSKEVAFYSAGVAAWFNTTLEHDKGVFALSAGGIGLLVTLLTTTGVGSAALLVLYIAAISAFLVSLVTVLAIFRRNKIYLEQVFAGNKSHDPLLRFFDNLALSAFGIGAILTAIIGFATAVASYSGKERTVTNKGKPAVTTETVKKSFDGVVNLQPQKPEGATPAAPAPAQSPAPPPVSTSTGSTDSK